MMDDYRWDSAGPGNTGFVFVRSNCRQSAGFYPLSHPAPSPSHIRALSLPHGCGLGSRGRKVVPQDPGQNGHLTRKNCSILRDNLSILAPRPTLIELSLAAGTIRLFDAVKSSLGILLQTSSDQRFLMRLLHGPHMRDTVSFALLPISHFLNGPVLNGNTANFPWQHHPGMRVAHEPGFPPEGWIAAHASWQSDHTKKPAALEQVGAWHLKNGSYPLRAKKTPKQRPANKLGSIDSMTRLKSATQPVRAHGQRAKTTQRRSQGAHNT